jgi:hypothetical protein
MVRCLGVAHGLFPAPASIATCTEDYQSTQAYGNRCKEAGRLALAVVTTAQ